MSRYPVSYRRQVPNEQLDGLRLCSIVCVGVKWPDPPETVLQEWPAILDAMQPALETCLVFTTNVVRGMPRKPDILCDP